MRNNLDKFQWCPWCWNYGIHFALKQALQELNLAPEKTVVVTGIGCNSKMSQYLNTYGAETLHGRGIPFAIWVKLANPELTVISLSGDGDSYGIGLNHLLHAARKNINLLHITCDNSIYALTVGQTSPTTPQGRVTKSDLHGNPFTPFDPITLVRAAWGQRVKNTSSTNLAEVKDCIKEGIQFQGFAHLHIVQKCPSWDKK